MTKHTNFASPIKGLALTRLALAAAKGNGIDGMQQLAIRRWGEDSLPYRLAKMGGLEMLDVTKAEVAAGATVASNWAELLVDAESAEAEFFALVRERSLLGRISGFRRVPLSTRLLGAVTGFSAAWVGEGDAVPVSAASFDALTLPPRKVSALTVLTDEMVESADPVAEIRIRDDMVAAVAAAIDATMLDPANGGVAGIKPESLTYDAPDGATTASGIDDIRALIALFQGELDRAVLIGSAETFADMAGEALPNLGARGGDALGIPAIASSAAGEALVLIDPDGIAVAEGSTDLRVATDATIEMLDANPTGDSIDVVPGTAASTVSLWQTNSTAVMVQQRVNFQTVRPSVAYLQDAS